MSGQNLICKRFVDIKYSNKLEVIKQSINKKKINLKNKKKNYYIVEKLNSAKGMRF